jgi:hypothetical protein
MAVRSPRARGTAPEFTPTGLTSPVRPCVSPRVTAVVEPPRDGPLGWLADPPREGPDDPELDEVETGDAIAPERGTAPVLGPPE